MKMENRIMNPLMLRILRALAMRMSLRMQISRKHPPRSSKPEARR